MDLGLTGKVALVTGSSRGIGRGVALTLAAEGCDMMLTGRDAAALNDVVAAVEKLGRKAKYETVDLRDEGAPAALAAAAKRAFGRIDILVNNAGTTKRGDFLALTDADWADGYALKFFAHVRLARAAWPILAESKGSINTIHPSYVETERLWRRIKADMERTGKDEAAVREWHRQDIGVTRFGTPEEIGGLVAFIVSPRGRWLHGATIDMDGGEVRGM